MKSWKYLKSTAKNGLLLLFCSLILLFSSCSFSVSPTYSREEIARVVENLCKKEFNLTVIAQETGNTIWIYRPVDKLINDQGIIDESAIDDTRNIFLSIRRVLLSMASPPKFYVFVISDIKTIGVDLFYVGFVPDMIKFQMSYISLSEMQEREVILHTLNPKALGDTIGTHIDIYDMKINEFISHLIKQDIGRIFTSEKLKNKFTINQLNSYYLDDKLNVAFDIAQNDSTKFIVDPFNEVKNSIRKFLKIYSSYEQFTEIEIANIAANKRRLYSIKALFSDKF